MLVLQALVEGSVLEAHPTGALSPDDCTPFVELYTQAHFGNDVCFKVALSMFNTFLVPGIH